MNELTAFSHSSPRHTSLPSILPLYSEQLRQYPPENPILIAVDRGSLQTIQRYRGVCLYCPEPPEHYQLNFCYRREVWVLYAHLTMFSQAMALAHAIQWQGAAQLVVLRMQHRDQRRPHHD